MAQALRRRTISTRNSQGRASYAIGGGAANVAAKTNVAASLDDRAAAERFSAAVIAFSAGELARAARRTKAAAKGWKDASRAPGLASTINMARSIPAVRAWLIHELGEGADHESPEFIARVQRVLQQLKT